MTIKTVLGLTAAAIAITASPVSAQSMFTGSGPGTFSTSTTGNTATFSFADNSPGNAYYGQDNWTFSSFASKTGTFTFNYSVDGYSAFYAASAYADAFNGASSQTLYNTGTFGGYSQSGTFNLNLVQGQAYGITLGGRNFDSDARVQGTFSLTSNAIGATPTGAVPEPATWAMMLLGFGMIGAGLRYRRKGTKVSFA